MELWPFAPHTEAVEALEWQTSVVRCKSAEERHSTRLIPRQELQYSFDLLPDAFGYAKTLARTQYLLPILLPLWHERLSIAGVASGAEELLYDSTQTSLVSGGQILIWGGADSWELCTSTGIDAESVVLAAPLANAYARALVMPVVQAEIAQPLEVRREEHDVSFATARFLVFRPTDIRGLSGLTYPTYQGAPLITDRAVLASRSIAENFEHAEEVVDSETGLRYRAASVTQPAQGSVLCWRLRGLQERRNFLIWLWSMRGRQKSFYLPSWTADLELHDPIAAIDTHVHVHDAGLVGVATVPFDIAAIKTDGTLVPARVTAVAAGDPGVETLTLGASFGAALAVADVTGICYLTKSRFAVDRIELQHKATNQSTIVSVPTIEVPL